MTPTATRVLADGGRVDAEAEARFFSRLKMRNGTFKRTHRNRFAALEPAFAEPIAARARRIRHVLDLAVSSGVTTVEFADYLDRLGARFSIVATDAFIRAHIVDLGAGVRVLTDRDGYPLQYDVRGVAFRPWVRRLDYVSLGVLPRLAVRGLARRRALGLIAAGRSIPVELLSPRLAVRPDITLLEADILEKNDALVGRFDVVRAANILNRRHFRRGALSRAVEHVVSYLAGPGALLIVTRTGPDGRDDGTLFVRKNDGLVVLRRVGSGSEIEDDILAAGSRNALPAPEPHARLRRQ